MSARQRRRPIRSLEPHRTKTLPMRWVIVGSAVIIVMMWILLTFHPMKGAGTCWYQNLVRRCFRGGLRVSVRYRRQPHQRPARQFFEPDQRHEHRHADGHLRYFPSRGWTAPNYAVLALMIGGVVCIASAIAGATSQDLKTGFLVGSTPFWQQMGLLDRRHRFHRGYRRHAQLDEQRPRKIHPHGNSRRPSRRFPPARKSNAILSSTRTKAMS